MCANSPHNGRDEQSSFYHVKIRHMLLIPCFCHAAENDESWKKPYACWDKREDATCTDTREARTEMGEAHVAVATIAFC